jgi:hypothetical protein
MSGPGSLDMQAEATRVQRVLEAALDRHAGRGEEERAEALARTLRAELSGLPAERRGPILEALLALYPAAPAAPPAGDRDAERRLEREVEALQAALAAARAAPPEAPAPAAAAGALAEAVVRVLVGTSRDPKALLAGGAVTEERLVGLLRVLVAFVAEISRTYLGATADPDKTMAGHLQSVLADELQGRRQAGSLEALLEQLRRQLGGQLVAFREACESGAQNLLRQLTPSAIADGSGSEGVRIFGSRPFYHRECWERFEARWEELRKADNLYETYFDGAFRRTQLRARGAERTPKGG